MELHDTIPSARYKRKFGNCSYGSIESYAVLYLYDWYSSKKPTTQLNLRCFPQHQHNSIFVIYVNCYFKKIILRF